MSFAYGYGIYWQRRGVGLLVGWWVVVGGFCGWHGGRIRKLDLQMSGPGLVFPKEKDWEHIGILGIYVDSQQPTT